MHAVHYMITIGNILYNATYFLYIKIHCINQIMTDTKIRRKDTNNNKMR